jgi:hypothetical protein
MNRRRVGEDMGSKETDGCPLTSAWIEQTENNGASCHEMARQGQGYVM